MDEEIKHQNIEKSHGLDNRKHDKNESWSIVIKFSRYNVRARILTNKRKLKGKQISVTESITKTRMEKLHRAREEHSFRHVWPNDGNILYVEVNNNNRVKVFYD